MIRKRWIIQRHWAGQASMMEPQTVARYWSRRHAQRIREVFSEGQPPAGGSIGPDTAA